MKLTPKSIEKLRDIINGDNGPFYRTGEMLVDFFNEVGFQDCHGPGFPSRRQFTDDKLKELNGTRKLEKCIQKAFAVNQFIGNYDVLDRLIADFNEYIVFDKWQIFRDNDKIIIKKRDKVIIECRGSVEESLKKSYDYDIRTMGLEKNAIDVISYRLNEAESCVVNDAPLSAVIMLGSILEGMLLLIANKYPKLFNQTQCSPKDKTGNVKRFSEWTLTNLIDSASEIGFLKEDIKRFSLELREFRNYVHLDKQMASGFSPTKETAEMCLQVLKGAISQIKEYHNKIQGETN